MLKDFLVLLAIGLPFTLGSVELGKFAGKAWADSDAMKKNQDRAAPAQDRNPCPSSPDNLHRRIKGE